MNSDDPKLTAYALDELDPAERAEIEQLLRDDPAARAELEETAAFAARLRAGLQAEAAEPLAAEQRAAVLALAESAEAQPVSSARPWWRRPAPLALAASIAFCAGATVLLGVRHYFRATLLVNRPGISAPSSTKLGRIAQFVIRTNDWITDGDVASQEGDYRRAYDHYKVAVDLLARSDRTTPHYHQTLEKFCDAGVKLAEKHLADGHQEEARAILLTILDPNYNPVFKAAILTLDRIESRNYTNRTIDPTFRGNVERVKQHFTEAQSLYEAGRYDLAREQIEQVRTLDPYNLAALKFEQKLNHAIDQPVASASTEKVPGTLRVVDKAWANPIRHFNPDVRLPSKSLSETKAITLAQSGQGSPSPALPAAPSTSTLRKDISTPAARPAKPFTFTLSRPAATPPPGLAVAAKPFEPLPPASPAADAPFHTEAYDALTDNAFLAVRENPLSTFSIDVDTASYANVRRFLNQQTLPPKGAVRIEELLNYFPYDYPQPAGDAPFSATMEVAACPWAPEHRLVRIGLKGREIAEEKRPASNLVFLIDVSGSMQPENKLPLLKKSLRLLVDRLATEDSVAIAVYAGASGTVLEPTHDRRAIREALDRLESGGSTNGAAGIQLAYRLAEQRFLKGGVNRVILATDGDFNVGVTSQSELLELIERKARSGVFLTVLGFGMGNLKDSTLEKLADRGNGNYAYIDTLNEARKVLVEQINGTLVTIAKDVKIQVEFNPAQAAAYRLIGYENRLLAKEDFNDDKKDAGEIGAGHTVTALYEVVPAGQPAPGTPAVDPLKYQQPEESAEQSKIQNPKSKISPELLTLKLRYKQPDGDTSRLLEFPLTDGGATWEQSSRDFRFAAAVAGFGILLRDSPHKGRATWDAVRELAVEGRGEDRSGYRAEFLTLLDQARALAR